MPSDHSETISGRTYFSSARIHCLGAFVGIIVASTSDLTGRQHASRAPSQTHAPGGKILDCVSDQPAYALALAMESNPAASIVDCRRRFRGVRFLCVASPFSVLPPSLYLSQHAALLRGDSCEQWRLHSEDIVPLVDTEIVKRSLLGDSLRKIFLSNILLYICSCRNIVQCICVYPAGGADQRSSRG